MKKSIKTFFQFIFLTIIMSLFVLVACEPIPDEFDTYTLDISIDSENSGTVNKTPVKTAYKENENVYLIADPYDGYKFSHWEGDLSGNENPTSIVMDDHKHITAVFVIDEYTDIKVLSNDLSIVNGANPGYDFKNIRIESEEITATFVVKNEGTIPLQINNIFISGDTDVFTLEDNQLETTILPLSETSFDITLAPKALGKKSVEITLLSNDDNNNIFKFIVRGNIEGYPKIITKQGEEIIENSTESIYKFSDIIDVDLKSDPVMFEIENSGEGTLNINNIYIDGNNADEFILDTNIFSYSLSPQEITNFFIILSPNYESEKEAVINIETDDQDNPHYKFTVKGRGQGYPEIEVETDERIIENGLNPGHDFGNTQIDLWTSYVEFRIKNIGSSTLLVNDVTFIGEGNNYSMFFYNTSTLEDMVLPGEYTTFYIRFKPYFEGLKEIDVVIDNNDSDESVYTFSVVGTGAYGQEPEILVTHGEDMILSESLPGYDFGEVNINKNPEPEILQIKNIGIELLEINNIYLKEITPDSPIKIECKTEAILEQRESMNLELFFNPDTIGDYASELFIESNDTDEGVYRVIIIGKGVVKPDMKISIDNEYIENNLLEPVYNYGFVGIGDTIESSDIIIINDGVSALEINDITISGKDYDEFSIDSSQMSNILNPDKNTIFKINAIPNSPGTKEAIVTINSNDTNKNPFIFNITSYSDIYSDITVLNDGIELENGSNPAHDYGEIEVDYNSLGIYKTFTIRNDGQKSLVINNISIINGNIDDFEVNDFYTTEFLPTDNETSFDVIFKPQTGGDKTALVQIETNDPYENPYFLTVEGKALTYAEINIKQGNNSILNGDELGYNFNDVDLGTVSQVVLFTIENTGIHNLEIEDILLSDGNISQFTLDAGALPKSIAPNNSAYFSVIFNPTALGTKLVDITVVNSDNDENPYSFTIRGTCPLPTDDLIVFPGDMTDLEEWRDLLIEFVGDDDMDWFEENGDDNFITFTGDVKIWATFVFEEAGYKNRFGYYSYDDAPTSLDQITDDERVTIFDNSSAEGSGGILNTGDTIFLEDFEYNENNNKVAFWLHQDGYNNMDNPYWLPFDEGTYGVDDTQLNIDSKRHIMTFIDSNNHQPGEKGYIIFGYEDLTGLGDRDFDDIIVIITVEPVDPSLRFEDVIDTTNMVTIGELEQYLYPQE